MKTHFSTGPFEYKGLSAIRMALNISPFFLSANLSFVRSNGCNCPEPCKSVKFAVSSSASFAPTQTIMKEIIEHSRDEYPYGTTDEAIEKNLRLVDRIILICLKLWPFFK